VSITPTQKADGTAITESDTVPETEPTIEIEPQPE
jgi:hypothetical protein